MQLDQALESELNAPDGVKGSSSSIFIPKAAFGSNSVAKTYRFKLKVTDFLGSVSLEITHQIDGLAGLKPAVSLLPYTPTIYSNTKEVLSAEASLPVCMMEEV